MSTKYCNTESRYTFLKFAMVGIVNTIVGTTVMFVFYNVFHFNYWVSSVSNYIFGSLVSYLLNKHYTFNYHEKGWWSLVRFTVTIIVCYLLAYGIAKPVVSWLLLNTSMAVKDNVSMTVGMILFVLLNYIGQRFFAFKRH